MSDNLISQPVPGVDPKYGGIIKAGDAARPTYELVSRPDNNPRGRPAMSAREEALWDAHQAKHRSIPVLVICNPPVNDKGEPMKGFYSAKRFWPAGATDTLVSPHELLELESERGRLQVQLRGKRTKHISVPALIGQIAKQARDEEARAERVRNGEELEDEVEELEAAPAPAAVQTAPATPPTAVTPANPPKAQPVVAQPAKK